MNKNFSHPSFPKPEDENISLWRYMDKEHFLWLVNEKRLYIPPFSILGDDLEGRFLEGEQQFVKNDEALRKYRAFVNAFSKSSFALCWHMNAEKSPTGWDKFRPYPESGKKEEVIAMRSTYTTLRDLMPEWVSVGTVQYKDKQDHFSRPNVHEAIMTKDKTKCEWEKEVRAVATRKDIIENDPENLFMCNQKSVEIYAPLIDLSKLILEIRLHPESSEEYQKFIYEVLKKEKLEHALKLNHD